MRAAVASALLLLAACFGKIDALPGNPSCELPPGVSATSTDDGCHGVNFQVCDGAPDGGFGCTTLCPSGAYALECSGPGENETGEPGPAPALGCTLPGKEAIFTPLDVAIYCCPCEKT